MAEVAAGISEPFSQRVLRAGVTDLLNVEKLFERFACERLYTMDEHETLLFFF